MKTAEISVQLIDSCGSDLSVVNAARVSFDKESDWFFEDVHPQDNYTGAVIRVLADRDKKLISYLARHKHTSPFNHCFASFRVKAPIFVARQLVKHKFLPWNEVSRRYVDSEPEFWFPEVWRKRAENVKQGSGNEPVDHIEVLNSHVVAYCMHLDVLEPDDDTKLYLEETCVAAESQAVWALHVYQRMLEAGVCPEQARMVLPQNTMTEWIWSGTLGAWADMCRLRLDPHAQYETRLVAQGISAEMQRLFPESWKALVETK